VTRPHRSVLRLVSQKTVRVLSELAPPKLLAADAEDDAEDDAEATTKRTTKTRAPKWHDACPTGRRRDRLLVGRLLVGPLEVGQQGADSSAATGTPQ